MPWWNHARKPSVAERRQRAQREAQRLTRRPGTRARALSPIVVNGRKIASSFWGKAWCDNLESYRDYEYRLPRGRSYLRNGAVLDLEIGAGKIAASVSGSNLYEVEVTIKPVAAAHWSRLKTQCAGQLGSVIELLEGRLSDRVMQIITDREQGLFPKPGDIAMTCSCPDWATMCKHVAAVMYGVGARLDAQPELLFTLRKVAHSELMAAATDVDADPAANAAQDLHRRRYRQPVRHRARRGAAEADGKQEARCSSIRRTGRKEESRRQARPRHAVAGERPIGTHGAS